MKKTVKFVNLYAKNDGKFECGTGAHKTEKKAVDAAGANRIATLRIETNVKVEVL